jgi:hypothetical protein
VGTDSREPDPATGLRPAARLERPPELNPNDPRAKAIDQFNAAALTFATRIGKDDEKSRKQRSIAVLVLASVLVLGTFAVIALIVTQDDAATAIAAAVAVVGVLAVAGFVNPLQTIERDIVYRRWSDVITASFFLQAGDYHASLKDLRRATRQATADFAVLAASHGRVSARTLQAIESVAASSTETDEEDGGNQDSADQAASAISVTNPGKQESVVGTAVEGLKLVATGPDDLVFTAAGLPKGLVIDARTGQFSGTPTEATSKADVEITVTSTAEDSGKVAVGFTWVVTDPPGTPPTGKASAVRRPSRTSVPGLPPADRSPTGEPPSDDLRTGAPPTGAPPTGAPPTGAPPTGAPPTGAPATEAPAKQPVKRVRTRIPPQPPTT